MDINEHHGDSDDTNGDGEGVWSPDIEQCFQEALIMFPPCGRRKHILQEEGGGKMYGRNELIARHIMMRTGKMRTRKQVSSHIQVLARRKAKVEGGSSGIVSPASSNFARSQSANSRSEETIVRQAGYYDIWTDRPIVTQKIRLVEFSAFIEHRDFQPPSVAPAIIKFENSNTANTQLPLASNNIQGALVTANSTTDLNIMPYPVQQAAYPLASNHHLPAQFNQASSYQSTNNNNNNNITQYQQQNHLRRSQHMSQGDNNTGVTGIVQQGSSSASSSTGITRHSYVQINYPQAIGSQTNKLERIDISQIQDKFPEISGSEGLFQRGPSDAFFLVKFWADLNNDYEYNIQDQNSYFGFSSHFETADNYKDITCSTKACSYGMQVVEKVEKIYGAFNSSNGRFSYAINRSPMCEFMIQFIKKLRQLPTVSQMNSVLENFSVLQVITSECTSEILLCLAYVFEIASPTDQANGPQYHVYKLTKDRQ